VNTSLCGHPIPVQLVSRLSLEQNLTFFITRLPWMPPITDYMSNWSLI